MNDCPTCGAPPNWHELAEKQAKRARKQHAAKIKRLNKFGKCYDCGKPADGFWRCTPCRKRVNEYRKKR